jgi:hypothetical protein
MLKNCFYITLFTLVSWGGYLISYPSNTPPDLFYDGVFMEKIANHIAEMTRQPRAIGDYHHSTTRRYLIKKLNQSGLTVRKQQSTVYNPKSRTAAPVENIIASYPGTREDAPTLMLMAHYDAAQFNSTGAADDASGVAVIMEVVHAYLQSGQRPENNLLVLITDGEEVGLLGAQAFIREQLMNHDIRLIINLEARGSAGPVMMWPETVAGNRAVIEGFANANVPLPVTTSLHYEIYRQLPNDTDLTPFNQTAGIDGLNLAFIDNHYNYHTRQDTLGNLSANTLAHQLIQLKALLSYFADADLTTLASTESLVYFNLPGLGLITYDTGLNMPLWVLTLVLLIIGLWSRHKSVPATAGSWISATLAVVLIPAAVMLVSWLILWFIGLLFPGHQDIWQGFPYQGHFMMFGILMAAALLSSALWGKRPADHFPRVWLLQLIWLLLIGFLMYTMPGSGFLIWPVLGSALGLWLWQKSPRWGAQLLLVALMATGWLMGSVLINLPIALGVAMLPATAVILSLLLGLFTPVMAPANRTSGVLLACAVPVLVMATLMFQTRSFTPAAAHPTSLSYLYDSDEQQGYFFNYDVHNSGWNDALFDHAVTAEQLRAFRQNHKKPARHLMQTDNPVMIKPIEVNFSHPRMPAEHQRLNVAIKAHQNSRMLELYTREQLVIHALKLNDRTHVFEEPLTFKAGQRWLRFYFDSRKRLDLELHIEQGQAVDWLLHTHSIDLLVDERFDLQPRPAHQTPKPFISTDNVIVSQSLTFGFDE